MHCKNQGEKPQATRFLNLTTTALYHPEIANILLQKTGVDIVDNKPENCKDWSYFLDNHREKYRTFLNALVEERPKTEHTASDTQGSLVLLEAGEAVFWNDAKLLHGRASQKATQEALSENIVVGSGDRNLAHYATPFQGWSEKRGSNHLACLRLMALSTLSR